MLKTSLLCSFALSVVLFSVQASRANDFSMSTSESDAQVKLISPENRVEVTVVNQKKLQLPSYVKITLRDQAGGEREVDLSLMDSKSPELGQYRGSLPQNQESYVSVKLVIPFKGKKPAVLDSLKHTKNEKK